MGLVDTMHILLFHIWRCVRITFRNHLKKGLSEVREIKDYLRFLKD